MDRPTCQIENCSNLAEKYTGRDNPHYRRYCNTHRRKRNGRLNGWERVAMRKRMVAMGLGDKCEQCAITGPVGFLDLHHKDRNHANNTRENLALLCPNCHRLADLELHNGKSVAYS